MYHLCLTLSCLQASKVSTQTPVARKRSELKTSTLSTPSRKRLASEVASDDGMELLDSEEDEPEPKGSHFTKSISSTKPKRVSTVELYQLMQEDVKSRRQEHSELKGLIETSNKHMAMQNKQRDQMISILAKLAGADSATTGNQG